MKKLQVLLVEDDKSNVDLWDDAIALHNADVEKHKLFILTSYATTVADAISALGEVRIDAAVVDIRLHAGGAAGGHNQDGNEFVKHAVASRPIGIVVYSGQAAEADVGSYKQIQVMDRGKGLDQVLQWLVANAGMFAALRSVRDEFDKLTAKFFVGSLWPRWSNWASEHSEDVLHRTIARHAIAHSHDSMLLDNDDGAHAEEAYFVPSLRPRLDTGDLLEIDNEVWIVVTPRCDLARNVEVKSLVLVRCEDSSEKWATLTASDSKSSADAIGKLMQHKNSPKQHFLPPMRSSPGKNRGPWMAQFHDIRAEATTHEHLVDLVQHRFASLAPQFVPSLVERFGNYFSRIGTPDVKYKAT